MRRLVRARAWLPRLLAVFLCGASDLAAAPLYTADVYCHDLFFCGSMEINKYQSYTPTTFAGVGGVEIAGQFVTSQPLNYHYVQAITIDDSDAKRWFNDTSVPLPQPLLDTPPGGYKSEHGIGTGRYTIEDGFDYLPWYDENEIPRYYDMPGRLLPRAKAQADDVLTLYFETWLICTIFDLHNDDKLASNDFYGIAPLVGWTWGFDIKYKDVDTIGTDELADFTVVKRDFAWLFAPTADWTSALGAVYGAGANRDHFNITVGDCKDCPIVPEPASMLLLGSGLALVVRRIRAPR